MTYADEVAADSVKLSYRLQETSDFSPSVNSGSLGTSRNIANKSGITYITGGVVNRGMRFGTGSFGYRNSTTATDTVNDENSYEFWIKTTSSANGSIFGHWSDTSADSHWKFELNTSGKIAFFVNSALRATSTVSVNDGNWHHVVATVNRTTGTVKLYIDTTLDVSVSGLSIPALTSSAQFRIGGTGGSTVVGDVDEFAVYPAELSQSRITAHYNAAGFYLGTNVDVDVDTGTLNLVSNEVVLPNTFIELTTPSATLQAPAATAALGAGIDLAPGTLSLQAHEASSLIAKYSQSISKNDGGQQKSDNLFYASTYDTIGTAADNRFVIGFDYPAYAGQTEVLRLQLHLASPATTGTDSFTVRSITAPYSATENGNPVISTSATSITTTRSGLDLLDVASIVDPDNFYGFTIEKNGTGYTNFYTSEKGGGYEPTLRAYYAVEPEAQEIDAETPTLSATAFDPTVNIYAEITNSTPSVSLQAFDATVDVTSSPNAIVDVVVPTLSAVSYEPVIVLPVLVEASTPTVSLNVSEADIETVEASLVELQDGRISLVAIKPTDVNGEPIEDSESDDRYFAETSARSPVFWIRGNTAVNGILPNRGTEDSIIGLTTGVTNNGVTIGNQNGPEGRRTMYFDGNDFLKQIEPSGNEVATESRTLEFTMRTDRKNSYLMGGDDVWGPVSRAYVGDISFYLADGKLRQRRVRTAAPNQNRPAEDATLWTGFTDIADNQWHHIVIRGYYNDFSGNNWMEVWIDGQLELRRRGGNVGTEEAINFGFPDYIGGRENMTADQRYLGDMTEVVYYNYLLSEDAIVAQDDAMFGIVPVRPESGRINIRSHEATAKGNKTRMLWIDFGFSPTSGSLNNGGFPSFESFDHSVIRTMRETNSINRSYNLDGTPFQMFHTFAYNHVDERTESRRIIDLDKDVNMSDYDAIGFIGYPRTSDERQAFLNLHAEEFDNAQSPARWEKILEDVKNQIIIGKNVYVSSPFVASDLGFIDKFEFAPRMEEYGSASMFGFDGSTTTYYDAISAILNPFKRPAFAYEPKAPLVSREFAGGYYYDNHANDKYRIRNLVPGLTDIGGWIQVDEIHYREPILWADEYFAMKYKQRNEGLSVGDEFYYEGGWNKGLTPNILKGSQLLYNRLSGGYAAPMSSVRAGTVVASLGEKIGQGTQMIDNPYKDYATVIALQPGGTLDDGRQVNGKVFIDLTESSTGQFSGYVLPKDVVPSNEDQVALLPENRRHLETAESREWDFSLWRGEFGAPQAVYSAYVKDGVRRKWIMGADGVIYREAETVTGSPKASTEPLYTSSYGSWWDKTGVSIETMNSRGWKWLSKAAENNGDALIGAETPKVSLKANDVTIETARTESVDVGTARITLEAIPESDTPVSDANPLLTTPTITLKAGAYANVVELDSPNIALRSNDVLGDVIDESEVIGLTLLGSPTTIILNIMEEV